MPRKKSDPRNMRCYVGRIFCGACNIFLAWPLLAHICDALPGLVARGSVRWKAGRKSFAPDTGPNPAGCARQTRASKEPGKSYFACFSSSPSSSSAACSMSE